MFENTRRYLLGQQDRQTTALMMEETVQYMRLAFARLVQGSGPITKENILHDLGPDLVAEIKANGGLLTPEQNLALALQLFIEHPDLVALATKELMDLSSQYDAALTARLNISEDDDFEVVAAKMQAMQEAFDAVRLEFGTPDFSSPVIMQQIVTEHPGTLERFLGEMDALMMPEAAVAS